MICHIFKNHILKGTSHILISKFVYDLIEPLQMFLPYKNMEFLGCFSLQGHGPARYRIEYLKHGPKRSSSERCNGNSNAPIPVGFSWMNASWCPLLAERYDSHHFLRHGSCRAKGREERRDLCRGLLYPSNAETLGQQWLSAMTCDFCYNHTWMAIHSYRWIGILRLSDKNTSCSSK